MRIAIGFNIMSFAIAAMIVFVFHSGNLKQKISMIVGITAFVALITLGAGLMTNWS